MKSIFLPAALAVFMGAGWVVAPAQAAGCLKGAAVGGVAGHLRGIMASSALEPAASS